MNLSLAGTVLIVTGSTQGVGRAIALEAARNGAEAISHLRARQGARQSPSPRRSRRWAPRAHFVAVGFRR